MGGADAEVSDDHDRDPARVGVLRADGHRQDRRSGSGCAPRRARASSAASIPNGVARGRGARDGAASPRSPAQRRAAARSTCTRSRSSRPRITVRTDAGQPAARHRRSPTPRSRDLLAPLGIEVDGRRRRDRRADVPPRPRARDRPRRGGRAAASGSTTSARTVPSSPEKIGGLTRRAARAPRRRRRARRRGLRRGRTRSRCSRRPTSRAPGSRPTR